MNKLADLIEFSSGTPQFRIQDTTLKEAPTYWIYSQSDLQDDLLGNQRFNENKSVRTFDEVSTLNCGDVIFSLISGTTAIVQASRQGYLFTQNYIKLILPPKIDKNFFVFYLNEDRKVRKQFSTGLQGSIVMKYTLKQLRELMIDQFPDVNKQKIIGDIYIKQLRLEFLKKQTATLNKEITLAKLKESLKHE